MGVVEALNFLGFSDGVLTITGFKTAHARMTFEKTPLRIDVPIHAWELCHVSGLTFADEYECTFVGGPPERQGTFKANVLTYLIDRLLYAVVVENRNVLKTVFKIVDKQNQHGIVEV